MRMVVHWFDEGSSGEERNYYFASKKDAQDFQVKLQEERGTRISNKAIGTRCRVIGMPLGFSEGTTRLIPAFNVVQNTETGEVHKGDIVCAVDAATGERRSVVVNLGAAIPFGVHVKGLL